MKFCSADISALYTNLSIEGCIDDTIQMASEFIDSLDLLGLKLVDVHNMLELVLVVVYILPKSLKIENKKTKFATWGGRSV